MHIVICWELGDGYGHVLGFRPLIQKLLKAKHQVTVFASHAVNTYKLCSGLNVQILPSPNHHPKREERLKGYANYADILYDLGYKDPQTLDALVTQWQLLFDMVKPDKLICDHSPTAMLAAKIEGIPSASYGTGYCLPPKQKQLTAFTSLPAADIKEMHQREKLTIKNINALFNKHGLSNINEIFGIFAHAKNFLFTLPELDHNLRNNEEIEYLGPRFDLNFGTQVDWKRLEKNASKALLKENKGQKESARILVYLKQATPSFEKIIGYIAQCPFLIAVYVPNPSQPLKQFLAGKKNIVLSEKPFKLSKVLPEVDLVINNAGHGMTSACLLHATHCLLMPLQLEQMLLTKKLTGVHLAAGLNPKQGVEQLGSMLQQLCINKPFGEKLSLFKNQYNDVNLEVSINKVVDWCEN